MSVVHSNPKQKTESLNRKKIFENKYSETLIEEEKLKRKVGKSMKPHRIKRLLLDIHSAVCAWPSTRLHHTRYQDQDQR